MSPKTAHTTCLQAEASPRLDVKEPSASHQLVPVHQSVSLTAAVAHVTQRSILDLQPGNRPRLGKIARLPKQYRDMVSRMLRNNCSARNIVDALDELGIKVTQRNISNWKTRGGYFSGWSMSCWRASGWRRKREI